MRSWFSTVTLLLMAVVVSSTELDELLRTPQYLVISQYNCETIFEMNVAPKTCPRALVVPRPPRMSDTIDCKIPFRAHLIRDPAQKFPPKIFFLGPAPNDKGIAGILEDIKLPDDEIPSRNRFSYSQHTTLEKPGAKVFALEKPGANIFDTKKFKYQDVVGSIYDTSSQMLYVIADVRGTFRCFVYYLKNIFNTQPSRGNYDSFALEYVNEFSLHTNNGARFDWVEDPYNHTVYYSTKEGDVMALHAFPISRLLPVLREGVSGHVIASVVSEIPTHYRVTGNGALISLGERDGFLVAYIRSIEHSLGIVCSTRHVQLKEEVAKKASLYLPPAMPIIVVRDEDFCMLRDGRDADLKACAAERQQWRLSKGLENDDDGAGFLLVLLIVVVIILATVILLLLVCICWLKRSLDETFDEEPQRPVQFYHHQPAQYVDMDVSVDRWNY